MSEDTRTPDEIRREIEHTREELAETAAALAEKTDVKTRAQEKLDETKAKVTSKVDEAKAKVAGGAGAAKQKTAEATPESFAHSAQQAADRTAGVVRQNPLPAVAAGFVAGALLAWLIAGRRNRS